MLRSCVIAKCVAFYCCFASQLQIRVKIAQMAKALRGSLLQAFIHLYTVEAETVTLCKVTGLQGLLVAPESSIFVHGATLGSCDPVFSHPIPTCSYEPFGVI